ncbi:MAG TPA: hypothetical protein VMW75_12655, partial [Thermoanaerobaculia bacterium]|nr:hypothetical protein [Thermoanaerobaculia bacterium]
MNEGDAVHGSARSWRRPLTDARAGAMALAAAVALAATVALAGAPLAGQGTSYYTVAPCRLVDTRGPA